MPSFRLLSPLLLLALVACGHGGDRQAFELRGGTMGTSFSVTVVAKASAGPGDGLRQKVTGALDGIEKAMSTYLIDSDVSRFNASRSTGWFPVSPMVCAAVEDSLKISALTGGAFDITVGPVVNLWGFGPDEARVAPPAAAVIAAAKDRVGYSRLETDCSRPALRKRRADVAIDLSGYAKGYAADRVAALLDAEGLTDYMIEIGGELRLRGRNRHAEKWRVAIEMPSDSRSDVERIVPLGDAAVATSGDYRNFFEFEGRRYSHTIDPRTGAPVTHDLAAVTIVTDNAAFADAMATALLVMGPEKGMRFAKGHGLAVFFQQREQHGFSDSMSPAFDRMERSGKVPAR